MLAKTLFAVLVAVALGFAAAPSWVANGITLQYTAGSDTVSFTVLERTNDSIRIEIKPSSAPKPSKATENSSASSGQFWFDSSLLATASTGSTIEDFSVTGESRQTFAGREWDTITLEAELSGSKTTRVYDKQSGLMLKQSVDDPNAPLVTLSQYNIPGLAALPPSPPPSAPPQASENDTTPPAPDTAEPSQPPTQPPSGASEGGDERPAKRDCLAGALLLALLGFAVFRES